MGTTAKVVEGTLEAFGGTLRRKVGHALKNRRLEAEGRLHELKGRAKVDSARSVERIKGKAEEVAGRAMSAVGELVGDEATEAEGKVHEIKGTERQRANRRKRSRSNRH